MYQPEGEGRARARRIISGAGYKCGGHFAKGGGIRSDEAQDKLEITSAIHQHEGALHPGSKKTRLRLADGGIAGGGIPTGRADRPARGGKKPGGGKTHVNILIAPQGDKAGTEGPPPGGMPMGGPPPGGPPMMPPRPPPPPMAPPTGAPPMGVGAPMGGAPPMMRKAGGRAGRRRLQDGGGADSEGMQMGGMPLPPAQGGGLRRAQGLGPPGWPGNPAPGMPPGGGMPPAAMPLPPAQGGGLNRAMGIGPPGWPGNPSAGAPSMGAPAGGQASAIQAMQGPSAALPPGMSMGAPTGGGPPPSMSMMAPAGAGPGMGTPAAGPGMGAAPPQRKRGGRTPAMGRYSPPDMEAGAGSGAGRLDKIGK